MKSRVWKALPLHQRPGLQTGVVHTFRYSAKVRLLEFCPLGEASSLILKFGQRLGRIQSRIHGFDGRPTEHAVKALTLSVFALT